MEPESLRSDQQRISDVVQSCTSFGELDSEVRGGLLTGWVLVAEWMAPDGDKWLSQLSSPNSTSWQRKGYLQEALDGWDD